MIILALETSCDETSACVLEVKQGKFNLLSNIVASQINIHKKYGGVVPEVAARKHVEVIIPVIKEALIEAFSIKNFQESLSKIDCFAVSNGPGLNTSLLVGTQTAKTLSYILNKPLVAVNHIEAHIYSNCVDNAQIKFPALALIVSGGHTQLILMSGHGKYKIVGQTQDDAAGEAFDKVARILGLEYPGGPVVSKLAEKGDVKKYKFPRPMIESKNFDFSFSGLKTAVLYTVKDSSSLEQKIKLTPKNVSDICAGFQQAVVDVLISKTIKAAKKYNAQTVLLGGGVSANKLLRSQLQKSIEINLPNVEYKIPDIKYSTDNAAMIAAAAYFHAKAKDFTPIEKLKVDPNLEIA